MRASAFPPPAHLRLACAAAVLVGAACAPARLDGALEPTTLEETSDLERRRATWSPPERVLLLKDIHIRARRASELTPRRAPHAAPCPARAAPSHYGRALAGTNIPKIHRALNDKRKRQTLRHKGGSTDALLVWKKWSYRKGLFWTTKVVEEVPRLILLTPVIRERIYGVSIPPHLSALRKNNDGQDFGVRLLKKKVERRDPDGDGANTMVDFELIHEGGRQSWIRFRTARKGNTPDGKYIEILPRYAGPEPFHVAHLSTAGPPERGSRFGLDKKYWGWHKHNFDTGAKYLPLALEKYKRWRTKYLSYHVFQVT